MAFLCPSRLGRRKHKKGISLCKHCCGLHWMHNQFVNSADPDETAPAGAVSSGSSLFTDHFPFTMGRDTGNDSMDTITKMELGRINAGNPDSRRIILQNFASCDPDELTVKQGQKVNLIFREGDWSYVRTDDDKEGFVPFVYCAKLGPRPVYSAPAVVKEKFKYPPSSPIRQPNKTLQSETNGDNGDTSHKDIKQSEPIVSAPRRDLDIETATSIPSSNSKLPKFLEVVGRQQAISGHICSESFTGTCGERAETPESAVESDQADPAIALDSTSFDVCTVQYNYEGGGADDISAETGERVRVLDGSDLFWYLVQKEDLTKGYIPKYYLQSPISSPRSESGSYTSEQTVSSDDESTPRNTPPVDEYLNTPPVNEHLVNTQQIDLHNTHDPVVVPCNTQFMKSPPLLNNNTHSSVLNSGNVKQIPVKPPRANKPKPTIQQTDVIKQDKRHSSRQSRQHRNESSGSSKLQKPGSFQEHLSESMKLNLLHDELDKLTPLQSRYSVASSMTSYDEDVFGGDVLYQLDQLRPTSAPPYKMYKYQREKDEYYDEYFYEFEPAVKDSDKDDVINVAEILEIRDALNRVKEDERKAKSIPKVLPHTNIASNLKQYMLTLPTTVLGHDGAKPARNTSKNGKGTRRYYVSQVDDDESVLYSQPNKVKHKQDESKEVKSVDNASNEQTAEKVKVGLKKRDWSFGYPRKTKERNLENDVNSDLKVNETDNNDADNVSVITDIQDDAMEALLNKTGGLLDQTKDLLIKKPRHRTANPQESRERVHESVLGRNIEFTDATEKCNHYLTNLILGKNVSNESGTVADELSEADNTISGENDISTLTNKSEVDENENIKLSHGISADEIGKPKVINGTHPVCDDIRGITEFVVQFDYTPTSDTAIPLVHGEVLHIGLDHQEDNEWYWAYSPRLKKYGYVPKLYVRIPMVTII